MNEYQRQAMGIVEEIRMSMIDPGQAPDLSIMCIKGLQFASDPLLKVKAIDLMDKVDSCLARNRPQPEAFLGQLVAIYARSLTRQTYEPIQQINVEAMMANSAKMAFLVAKVSAMETSLSQDRAAVQRSYGRTCYNCGKTGHLSPDCPDPRKDGVATSQAAAPTSHGLDRNLARLCNEKIKARLLELGDPRNIPEGARYDIVLEGKVVAKYCNHCRRFIKGHNSHYTTEHTGPRQSRFKSKAAPSGPSVAAPGDPPGPAIAAVASLPLAETPLFQAAPPTLTSPSLFRCELPDYETPSAPSSHLPDRVPSDYNAFLNCVDITTPFDLHGALPESAAPLLTLPQTEGPQYFSPSEWDSMMLPNWGRGHND